MIKFHMKPRGSILCQGWFVWLVFLSVIQPDYLVTLKYGVQLFNLINIAAFAMIVVDFVNQKSFKLDWGIILIFLVQACLLISSLINSANVSYSVKKLLMIVNVAIVTSKNLKTNAARFIEHVYWLLYICIGIHFVTLLLYPNGIFTTYYEYQGTQIPYLKHWFLSTGNNYVLTVLPAFFLDRIRLYRRGKKTDAVSLVLYLMGFFGMFKSMASTSLIACLLFVAFAVLLEWKKIPMPSLKVYAVLGVALFALLVFADLGNVLGKLLGIGSGEITFTGRTDIWAMAVDWIAEQPLIGYGYEREALLISKFGGKNYATHCHNLYLDLCYRTGIIGLTLFIVMLFKCSNPLTRRKHNPMSILLSFTFFLYLGILFQMEAYFNLNLFYALLMFGFNIENWVDQVAPEKRNEVRS